MLCYRGDMKLARAILAVALLLSAHHAAAQPQKLHAELGGSASMDFILVPAGSFEQGSAAAEVGHQKDEEPKRTVKITRGFFMGVVPVTRGQFAQFVAETRYRTEAEKGTSGGFGWNGSQLAQKKEYTWQSPGFAQGDDSPVVIVTYADAEAFLAWLQPKLGRKARLPTEAEFEYAARGGTTTPWWSGSNAASALEHGWFLDNAGNGTRPVGTKGANAFGLSDMSGNVWQWCSDWYGPYAPGEVSDPAITSAPAGDTARRVLRGGSWLKPAASGRSAARYRNTPGSRNADNGFRVVAGLDLLPAAPTTTTATPSPTTTTPTNTPPAPQSSGSLAPLGMLTGCCGLGFVGVVALAVVLLVRRRGGATTIPKDDGFTIESSYPPGTRVRYACTVRGMEVSDVIIVEGSRTFVYTGDRPQGIRIVSVEMPNAPGPAGGYRGVTPRAPTPPPPRSDPPFRGYPPAY